MITRELTTQAEQLYYRLRTQGDRIWQAKRLTRPGTDRERMSRQWRRTEHARERAYKRMNRRRQITGWTLIES